MVSPARTAATSPDAPASSAGIAATNGTAKDSAVVAGTSCSRDRTQSPTRPTSTPISAAPATAQTNRPATPNSETPVAAAAIAARSTTRAVASLSSPSPSRIVTARAGTPSRRAIEVATASVGLTTAPRATPQASPSPGTTRAKKPPRANELSTTRTTDRPLTADSSRRRSMAGTETAAE